MFQTEHLGNVKALWVSVFIPAAIAGARPGREGAAAALARRAFRLTAR